MELYYEDTGRKIFVNENYIFATDNGTGVKIWKKNGVMTINDTYNITVNFTINPTQYYVSTLIKVAVDINGLDS